MDTSSDYIHSDDEHSDGNWFGESTFANTFFDQYFAQNHKPARTSTNVFSNILSPLTSEQFTSAIANSADAHPKTVPWLKNARIPLFTRILAQLGEGFNVMFYGAGSKRDILNALTRHINKRKQDVIVVNAFNPAFALKDLLSTIEDIPALASFPTVTGTATDAQTRRIHKFYSTPDNTRDLYLVIHNIDAPPLRTAKAQASLSTLASAPRIHIVASADNIAFPHLWSLSDIFARNATVPTSESEDVPPSKGYGWLFHDLTTLAPYDFELAYADRSSLSGASQAAKARAQREGAGTGAPAANVLLNETAARHILVSVTQKAKKLFVLLGTKQLELMGDGNVEDAQTLAYDYGMLFNLARDDFVATNDTALRALMTEFKDHGLMVLMTKASGGGEAVWIPMRKDALEKIVKDLKAEQL